MNSDYQKMIIPLTIGLILVAFLLPVGINSFNSDNIAERNQYNAVFSSYNAEPNMIVIVFDINATNTFYADFSITSNNTVNATAQITNAEAEFYNTTLINTSNQTLRVTNLNSTLQIALVLSVVDSTILDLNASCIYYVTEPIEIDSSIESLYYLVPIFGVIAIIFTIFMKKSKF